MSYLLKDNDKLMLGFFSETPDHHFQLLVTDLNKFFIEKITKEELAKKLEANEDFVIKPDKAVKVLKEQIPESSTITSESTRMRIDLEFRVSGKMFKISFNCDETFEAQHEFSISMMKTLIEQNVMISKLRTAIEAKDLEIDEYKRHGGTLLRGKKSDFLFY
jgi:hypothetical protein